MFLGRAGYIAGSLWLNQTLGKVMTMMTIVTMTMIKMIKMMMNFSACPQSRDSVPAV